MKSTEESNGSNRSNDDVPANVIQFPSMDRIEVTGVSEMAPVTGNSIEITEIGRIESIKEKLYEEVLKPVIARQVSGRQKVVDLFPNSGLRATYAHLSRKVGSAKIEGTLLRLCRYSLFDRDEYLLERSRLNFDAILSMGASDYKYMGLGFEKSFRGDDSIRIATKSQIKKRLILATMEKFQEKLKFEADGRGECVIEIGGLSVVLVFFLKGKHEQMNHSLRIFKTGDLFGIFNCKLSFDVEDAFSSLPIWDRIDGNKLNSFDEALDVLLNSYAKVIEIVKNTK